MFDRRSRFPPFQPGHFPSPYGFLPVMYPKRQFPEVNISLFVESAKMTKILLLDVAKLLDKIEQSPSFSKSLMDAAQRSDMQRVKQLINEIGLKSAPEIDFNPDGLRLSFSGKAADIDCCRVNLVLRWG